MHEYIVRKRFVWGRKTSAITCNHIQFVCIKLLMQESVLGAEATRNKTDMNTP